MGIDFVVTFTALHYEFDKSQIIQQVTQFTKKRNDGTTIIKLGAAFITLKDLRNFPPFIQEFLLLVFFLIHYGVEVSKKYGVTLRSSKKFQINRSIQST